MHVLVLFLCPGVATHGRYKHGHAQHQPERRGALEVALDLPADLTAADLDGMAVPAVLPDAYRALTSYGFDLNTYLAQQEVRS